MCDVNALRELLKSRPKIVVTADFSAEGIASLRRLGDVASLGWAGGDWFADRDALMRALDDADILVAGYEPIDRPLIEAANRLRIIASVRGSPSTNVDVAAATEREVLVLGTEGRTDQGVAEFCILLILALARHLVPAVQWMREPPAGFVAGEPFQLGTVWGEQRTSPQLLFTGCELNGRTVGLIGCGAIGRTLASKLRAFDVRLLVHDPFVNQVDLVELGAEPAELKDLLEMSDFVSLHARVTPSSTGLVDRKAIRAMKPGAFLINTGRAALVDEAALLEALDDGHLGGAALDVFSREPPAPADRLVTHARVLPTPHLAAWTTEMNERHSRSVVEALHLLALGHLPPNVSNPEILERSARAT